MEKHSFLNQTEAHPCMVCTVWRMVGDCQNSSVTREILSLCLPSCRSLCKILRRVLKSRT